MELADYIHILRKNWVLIAVITLLAIGAAAIYSLVTPAKYTASSSVVVSTQVGESVQDLQQGNAFTLQRVTTYTSLSTMPLVLTPVIKELGLDITPEALSKQISATNPLNTTLITITATSSTPDGAAKLADAVAASLSHVVETTIENPTKQPTSPVTLTLAAHAIAPLKPSSPKVPLNLVLGLLVGLALGAATAVTRTVLDTRVRTPKDVEQITDVPMIGAITFDPRAAERPLIVHVDPLSPRAESFRTVRTNLQFLDMGGRSSFVVTSSVAGEGKSTTAVNLAIALADAGMKVALVDADLRKPKVAEYLGIEGGAGLTDVLIGRARVGDVMLPWGHRSMYVMPAGKIPPNPSELLGSKQMHALIEALERDFDIVLCDAPPLLPVTDGAILAKATSGAILVVAAGRTNRGELTGALESLQTVGAKTAGLIMTMVPTKGPDSYYARGYGHAYLEDDSRKAQKQRERVAAARSTGRRRRGGPVARPASASTESAFDELMTGTAFAPEPTTPSAHTSTAASTSPLRAPSTSAQTPHR